MQWQDITQWFTMLLFDLSCSIKRTAKYNKKLRVGTALQKSAHICQILDENKFVAEQAK